MADILYDIHKTMSRNIFKFRHKTTEIDILILIIAKVVAVCRTKGTSFLMFLL